MKTSLIVLIVVVLAGIGAYFYTQRASDTTNAPQDQSVTATTTSPGDGTLATTTQEKQGNSVIGTSVEGRAITAYHYGNGDTELVFVGGIHGGYEWNTALVAYELMDYLEGHPDTVPKNVEVTVIPVLNPDGLNKIVSITGRFLQTDVKASLAETVPGRFNANKVDLNRNFDCDWQATGTWQKVSVSGGSAAFSEPESKAFKTYIEAQSPSAVVVWYSAAGGVFASNCHNGVLAETNTITKKYADASGYPAYKEFNFYEITGDMVNWLAKQKIPAISVLLTNHQDTEWDKNWAGIEALLTYYAR